MTNPPLPPIPSRSAQRTVDERFAALENTIAALKDHLLTRKVRSDLPPAAQRRAHLDHTRSLLDRRGELTVNELRQILGVSIKTASRLMHALSLRREGHLFFEPAGSSERLVLLHPSRVAIERGPRSPAAN